MEPSLDPQKNNIEVLTGHVPPPGRDSVVPPMAPMQMDAERGG